MSKKTFEQEAATVDSTAASLAMLLLNFNSNKNIISYFAHDTYTPDLKSIYLKIDLIPLLAYNREYGLTKLKAMIKPWVSNLFAIHTNIDAVGFTRDAYGRAMLTKLDAINANQAQPMAIIFTREKEKDTLSINMPA